METKTVTVIILVLFSYLDLTVEDKKCNFVKARYCQEGLCKALD